MAGRRPPLRLYPTARNHHPRWEHFQVSLPLNSRYQESRDKRLASFSYQVVNRHLCPETKLRVRVNLPQRTRQSERHNPYQQRVTMQVLPSSLEAKAIKLGPRE